MHRNRGVGEHVSGASALRDFFVSHKLTVFSPNQIHVATQVRMIQDLEPLEETEDLDGAGS